MTEVWLAIGALAAATFVFRAVGPVWFGNRTVPPLLARAIAALPAALFAGLVVTLTFADGASLAVGPRVAGTLVGGIVTLRGGSMTVALVSAAAAAALIRLL